MMIYFYLKKISIVLIVLLILFEQAYCTRVRAKTSSQSLFFDSQTCEKCYEFSALIYRVINDAKVDIYIFDTCAFLCFEIVKHYNASIGFETDCNSVCETIGLFEFKGISQKIIDMGPILFCEYLKDCQIKDDGDAKIKNFFISPNIGSQDFL